MNKLRDKVKELQAPLFSILANVFAAGLTLVVLYLLELLAGGLTSNGGASVIPLVRSMARTGILILVVVSSLIIVFMYLIRLVQRVSYQVTQLKGQLRKAFLQALEDSSLNPTKTIRRIRDV